MRPEAAKVVTDAIGAIEAIGRFTEGKSAADYEADLFLRSAVERQLEIVGEALNVLRRMAPETAARVPDLAAAIGLRNALAHGYATINRDTVWETVSSDLPPLRTALRDLLSVDDANTN